MTYHVEALLIGSKNPSYVGAGYTIFNEAGTVIERDFARNAVRGKKYATSNDAELWAVRRLLLRQTGSPSSPITG